MSTKCRTCDKVCSYRTEDYVPEYAALLARHNALREAVAWEREVMDERVTESIYSHYMRTIPAALHDLGCLRDCARAEVDRLLEEGRK